MTEGDPVTEEKPADSEEKAQAAESNTEPATEEGDVDDSEDKGPPDAKAKKRKERLEQNRISARESRKRKKTMIEELQRTVITLSRENKDLNDRNEQLRSQLMEIGTKYPNVVPIQAILNGTPPPASQVPPNATQQQWHQQQQQAAAVAAATFNPLAYLQQQQQAMQTLAASSVPAPAPSANV